MHARGLRELEPPMMHPKALELARETLDSTREHSLPTYRLAMGLSLAAYIEPGLIRRLRLEVAPRIFKARFPVACEQELWFGPWVASRDHRAFRISPEYAELLRQGLR